MNPVQGYFHPYQVISILQHPLVALTLTGAQGQEWHAFEVDLALRSFFVDSQHCASTHPSGANAISDHDPCLVLQWSGYATVAGPVL